MEKMGFPEPKDLTLKPKYAKSADRISTFEQKNAVEAEQWNVKLTDEVVVGIVKKKKKGAK